MKTLRDFQKRRYSITPTVIGQHTESAEIDIPVLSTRIFENENANIDNLADENGSEGLLQMKVTSILMIFFSKQVKLQFSEAQMAFHLTYLECPKTTNTT